ncbi:acyltransferase family protein [Agrobacterium sp. NPDC090273]|uniref:acyltransferase family protein n=1 Tax=Agrobacterium sp. NPDC090273 TaxID=3363919 RepID=UPI003839DC99
MSAEAPRSPSRFVYIDCIRGLAALYVLLQHTLEYGGFIRVIGEGPYNWIANFGQAGVFAFFLVSGFVIPSSLERSQSSADFWVKRATRIYPLYLFIFALTFLFKTFVALEPLQSLGLTFFGQIFFLNSWVGLVDYVEGSWTLVIEMMWYIGLFGWWKINGSLHTNRLLITAFVLCIIVSLIAIYSPIRVPLGRLGMMLACCWGLFVLDYSRGRFQLRDFMIVNALFLCTTAFILYVGFGLRPSSQSAEIMPFQVALSSWLIGAATFFFFYIFRASSIAHNKILIWLGTISYSVYLTHPLILRVLHYHNIEGYYLLLAGITLTMLVSTLTYRFIEHPFTSSSHGKNKKYQLEKA